MALYIRFAVFLNSALTIHRAELGDDGSKNMKELAGRDVEGMLKWMGGRGPVNSGWAKEWGDPSHLGPSYFQP